MILLGAFVNPPKQRSGLLWVVVLLSGCLRYLGLVANVQRPGHKNGKQLASLALCAARSGSRYKNHTSRSSKAQS